MSHKINIQIEKPEVDIHNKKELRECARILADDLTEQIIEQIRDHERALYFKEWETKLHTWDLERLKIERVQIQLERQLRNVSNDD